ncbi:MAG: RNA polymerase sigma factor [Gammaproteobacteria bacterium]|nr:RNA polymerase sigma factor [Gammaproteobacteria bacterium]
MSRTAQMNRFLADVEKRAFRMAQVAVKDADEALDIVQDTMFTLVRKYANKPNDEWRPLFYRILKNRITDWHRRNTVKSRVFAFFTQQTEEGEVFDPIEQAPDRESAAPDVRAQLDGAAEELVGAVGRLPARQQQAFLLRALEGLSVADTARAMKCSDGSVKTHYSRAVHSLREVLKEHWS